MDIGLGCAPVPTCNDVRASYSSCQSGGVPPGVLCQAVRAVDGVFDLDFRGCVPYPADGRACLAACGFPDGIVEAGVCPAGQVCAVSTSGSSGEPGQDCGCFTPPHCEDACGLGGGGCGSGTCTQCPPQVCPFGPACFCYP
jgi:hypothetical protein